MENESPLKKYSRQPKIYIDLPSKGKYYNNGVLYEDSATNLAVFSMTANDEILYRTPDALINGEATANNIKSCIPAITKPFELVTLDIDALLLSIRLATYGSKMQVGQRCKKCNEENTYEIDITKYIDYMNRLEFVDSMMYKDFKINFVPMSYKDYTDLQKESVGYQRALSIQLPTITNEDEKAKFQDQILSSIAKMNMKTILLSINSVEVDGEIEKDKKAIYDFIESYDVEMLKAIKGHIDTQYNAWLLPEENVQCSSCEATDKIRITIDQTDFFAKG